MKRRPILEGNSLKCERHGVHFICRTADEFRAKLGLPERQDKEL